MAGVIVPVLRRHWLIVTLVIAGVVLRGLTIAAYRPAIMFFGDSYAYILAAQKFQPPNDRPFGYAFVLRLVSVVGDLGLVVILQHLAGIALAVLIYVVLVQRGAPRWLGAVCAAPALLDGYVLQIEHNILSETFFVVLLVSAVLAVMRDPLTPRWAAAGGLLLAGAASMRTVAIPIAAVFVAYLLVRRVGVRRLAVFGAALALPMLGYMTWFASVYGSFGTTDSSGRFLYGRVAVFADCSSPTLRLTPAERSLCDNAPVESRPNANFYVWSGDSPLRGLTGTSLQVDQVASGFSRAVILDQPLTYARFAATDVAHYFAPGRYITRVDSPLTAWRFPTGVADPSGSTSIAHNDLEGAPAAPRIEAGPATFLRAYQGIVYTQGPLLLAGLALGIAAGFLRRDRRRWDGPFVASVGLATLVIPSMTVMFDYRYGLPAVILLSLSGGIGAIAVLERVRERRLAAAPEPAASVARGRHRASTVRPVWWAPVYGLTGVAVIAALLAASPMSRNDTYERYVTTRAELGALGPALGPVRPVAGASGVTEQPFVTGGIVASRYGAVVIPSRYQTAVDRNGGLAALGPPRGRESRTSYDSGIRYLSFENGRVYWSRLGGARAVMGPIYRAWSVDGVRQRFRDPVADAVARADGSREQRFAGGTITLLADGSIAMRLRIAPDLPTSTGGEGRIDTGGSANLPRD